MISVTSRTARAYLLPTDRLDLKARLTRLLAGLGLAGDEAEVALEVSLVDDAEMAGLNSEFLGLPGPTNVLAFPLDPDDDPSLPDVSDTGKRKDPEVLNLGLIALSVETMRREALLYGQDPLEHCMRLLTHAVLHLAGLDHGPEMEQMTEAALDAVL